MNTNLNYSEFLDKIKHGELSYTFCIIYSDKYQGMSQQYDDQDETLAFYQSLDDESGKRIFYGYRSILEKGEYFFQWLEITIRELKDFSDIKTREKLNEKASKDLADRIHNLPRY